MLMVTKPKNFSFATTRSSQILMNQRGLFFSHLYNGVGLGIDGSGLNCHRYQGGMEVPSSLIYAPMGNKELGELGFSSHVEVTWPRFFFPIIETTLGGCIEILDHLIFIQSVNCAHALLLFVVLFGPTMCTL